MSTEQPNYGGLDELGREIPDPRPVSIPVEMRRSESQDERIRRIIAHSLSVEAQRQGFETFEDADDFDIEDDPADPDTPWEKDFDLATVESVNRGVTAPPPDLTMERRAELHAKYSKRKPAGNTIKEDPPPEPKDAPKEG